MTYLLFIVLFIAAALFYLGAAVVCYRRGDRLMWTRLATGVGFALMAIGYLIPSETDQPLTFIGAILVFVSALATVYLSTRRARER